MKLTFRVNGSRPGDAARAVTPGTVTPVTAAASGGPRRLGLRVNGSRFATRPAPLALDVLNGLDAPADAAAASAGDRSAS